MVPTIIGVVQLTDAEAKDRFADARVARLATADSSSRPHLVPVTFAVDKDNRIYIAIDHKPKTTTNLRRIRNIRENAHVTLLVDHYEEDWRQLWWVRADGQAHILDDERQRERPIEILASKYEQYRETRPAGPVIVIEVERWIGWSGSS
jgi:PPOX class probable F420-dependent enzyme